MDERMEALKPYLESGSDIEEIMKDEKVQELFSTVKKLRKGITDHLNKRGYRMDNGVPVKKEDAIQSNPIKSEVQRREEPKHNIPALPLNIKDFMILKEIVSSDLVTRVKELEKKLEKGEDIHYTLDVSLVDKYKQGNSTKSMRVNDEVWKVFNKEVEKHNQLRLHSKGEALNILFANIVKLMQDKKL